MQMSKDEQDYILSLHGSVLSDEKILDLFAFLSVLDEEESAKPRSLRGKRVAVETFLELVHVQTVRSPPALESMIDPYLPRQPRWLP